MPSLIEQTRNSTLYVVPAQLVIKILGLAYVVVLARGLSVEEYGIYNFLLGALLVFSYLCNFGVASSLQRFLPEYSKLGQQVLVIKTVVYAHIFRIVLSVISLLVAIASFDLWAGSFGIADRYVDFAIFCVGAFLFYQIEYFQIEFNSLFMHRESSLVQVGYSALKFVLVYLVLLAGFNLTGVLVGEAVGFLVGTVMLIIVFVRHVYKKARTSRSVKQPVEWKRLGRYSSINALVVPGGILYSNSMDFFVIAAMANPHQLGIYALASRASKMLLSIMPHNILQSVIRPAFYHRYYSSVERESALNEMFQSLVSLIAAVLFPVLVVTSLKATSLITVVFGEAYADSVGIFLVLVVFSAFTVLEFPSDMVLQAIEKVEARLYVQVFAVYNIIGAVLLLPRYGVMGVAFATGSAQMLKCLFFYYMARYYCHVGVPWTALLKIAANSAVAGVVVVVIGEVGTAQAGLVVGLLGGVGVYLVMTVLNNFMAIREKLLVNQFCKRRVFDV